MIRSSRSSSLIALLVVGLVGCGGADGDSGSSLGAAGIDAAGSAGSTSQGKGGNTIGKGGSAAGTGGSTAGTGGSTAGTGGTSAGAGGSTAGTGGTSAGTGGMAAGGSSTGGGSGTGGSAGQNAGGSAGQSAGGSAGQNAGGSAGQNAGGSAGQSAGGSAGQNAGGSGGGTTGDGYTSIPTSGASLTVYVSATGNDGADGKSPGTAVKTIGKAFALAAGKTSAHILLKRGDTFNAHDVKLELPGTKASPFLFGAYGELTVPRPQIVTGKEDGLVLGKANHVVVQSIHLRTNGHDGSTKPYGIQSISGGGEGLLIEDCLIERFGVGISLHEKTAVVIRRNVVVDSHANEDLPAPNGHSQGIYLTKNDGILVEENVLDHNGWTEDASFPNGRATDKNHNAYIQADNVATEGRTIVLRNNVISRASAHGTQLRPGGIAEDNFFLRDPLGLQIGLVNGEAKPTPGGVSGAARRNVFLHAGDIRADLKRGGGLLLGNINAGGLTVEDNVFAKNTGSFPFVISLDSHHEVDQSCATERDPLTKVIIRHNTAIEWSRFLSISDCTPASLTGVVVEDNLHEDHDGGYVIASQPPLKGLKLGGNDWFTTGKDGNWFDVDGKKYKPGAWEAFSKEAGNVMTDPALLDTSRDVASYMQSIGLGTTEASFYAAVRKQRRGAYDQRLSAATVNAYFRSGFAAKTSDRGVR